MGIAKRQRRKAGRKEKVYLDDFYDLARQIVIHGAFDYIDVSMGKHPKGDPHGHQDVTPKEERAWLLSKYCQFLAGYDVDMESIVMRLDKQIAEMKNGK